MSVKNKQGNFYKHEEFMLMKEIDFKTAVQGFSVATNIQFVATTDEQLKDNFRSDFLSILMVQQGEIRLKLNMEEYQLAANDMLLITPHTLKQFIGASDDARMAALAFTPDFIARQGLPDNIMEVMGYFSTRYSPLWKLSTEHATTVRILFEELEKRAAGLAQHPFGRELLQHTFYILLYEMAGLSRIYAQSDVQQSPRKEALAISFTNLVQLHFTYQRNVSQYAEQLFVTAKYLTETVKEITGRNAGEIIDHFVIVEAKLLLDNPKLSIAQVAASLHFSDQSFFGKFFKRHTGQSPKDYRVANKVMPG
jgi:AraC family transcriptional regulator, transcriptional activator of pobA